MKRIFTLLWLTLAAFTFKAGAQSTTCNAEFSWQFINGNTVKFTPVTNDSPYVHHIWTFGDGTGNSSVVAPTHSYAANGTYNVVHTILRYTPNGVPVCTQSITHIIVIQQAPPCNLVVDFSWNATTTNPLMLEFHNLSTPSAPTDSVKWNFGDGSSLNGLQGNPAIANPAHTYLQPGTYNVCLIVRKNDNPTSTNPCIRYICKTVIVQAPCNLVADFNWTTTASNPLVIEFHNLSTPSAPSDSVRWTFGDGTSVNGVQGDPTVANPVHTYLQPGTYNVCIRVKKNNNTSGTPCVREICKTVIVQAPCNLVVDFNWTVTPTNPLRIEFHNLTTPLAVTDSIRWTFGDGTTSSDVNPVHIYTAPGTYTVCLRVIRYNTAGTTPCVREICKTIVVQQPCNLVVDFNWTVTPTNPLRLEFHNLSVPLAPSDSTIWSFGDGTTSYDVNPVHIYANAGTYNVCLIVKKFPYPTNTNPCIRYICKTVIVPAPCNLVADFSAQPDPNHPLRIKFTNLSTPMTPADSVRWTFGDGTSVSGVQGDPNVANPTHDYAQGGNYVVCLRVKKNNSVGTTACVKEICKTIIVEQPCNFQPAFSWHLDSLNNRKVYFTNLTNPPTAGAIATWYFGDGATATSWNAVHEYAQPGRYNVCLKIQLGPNSNCIKYTCDSIFIPLPVPPCTDLSKFHFEVFSNDAQKYKFTPDYINTTLQYTWTFGDGTGSHDPVAIHRYAQPGVYTACLTVWRSSTCASTTCKTVQVTLQINCDSVHVGYTYQADPQVPNKIHFYANSNIPILDQTWTITKLPVTTGGSTVTLHQNNPTYLFQDTGYYRVCLRAVTLGGCVKEYCSVIHIAQVSNACVLLAYPNPATSVVNVNVTLTQPGMIDAYVYNSVSVLVREKHQQGVTGNNVVTINVNDLPAGLYTIKLVYANHVCYAPFQKL